MRCILPITGPFSYPATSEASDVIGETGVGKTGLACSLLLNAVQNGYRGLFIKAQDLFDEMYASLADRSTRRLLQSLSKIDLLLIDEMGYIHARTEQTNIFFKLMEERHHRRPTFITTNLAYPEWQSFLGNRPLTEALLSRLCERCHTVKIEGPCLRWTTPRVSCRKTASTRPRG
jgi:DNA replication protein DnaC